MIDDANSILNDAKEKATTTIEATKDKLTTESDKVKDAFKAGLDAYNQEKTKKS